MSSSSSDMSLKYHEDQECPSGLDPRFAVMASVWVSFDSPTAFVC